eukprot:TRINITY_DN18801_c0_g2_i1.p1 TRINITY_DN18801_c0_g2~~TRINITY_DN18801_c0_g2_i1.p1  ORF type:complete len:389 (-),score=77.40 TRINITY_DN18801_c0_g2_i1:112-1221(-)
MADDALRSILNLVHLSETQQRALKSWLERCMQVPYKEWATLISFAQELPGIFSEPVESLLPKLFERVLKDGGWAAAASFAAKRPAGQRPWVVLCTGVNGIRKSTMMYQNWLPDALHNAMLQDSMTLSTSSTLSSGITDYVLSCCLSRAASKDPHDQMGEFFTGHTSFFRQLDFLIVTVANAELSKLYGAMSMDEYVKHKEAIFSKYRTLAEIWGILLVQEAKQKGMDIIIETTGKDDVMFKFVDLVFNDGSYRKLWLHASVNDVGIASATVEARMDKERKAGTNTLATNSSSTPQETAKSLIGVNQGGTTFGLDNMKKVEAASELRWAKVKSGEQGIGPSWARAGISILASVDPSAWTACAGAKNYSFS